MASTKVFELTGKRPTPPIQERPNIELQPPAEIPKTIPAPTWRKVLPIVFIVAFVAMMAWMFTQRQMMNPMMLMIPIMMGMSFVGIFLGSMGARSGKSTPELNEDRKEYLRFVARERDKVHAAAKSQYDCLAFYLPNPATYESFLGTPHMWLLNPQMPQFLQARVGIGRQRLDATPKSPKGAAKDFAEPVSLVAIQKFLKAHNSVGGMPIAVNLRSFSEIDILATGGADPLPLLRAVVAHIAAFHSPEFVRIAAITTRLNEPDWAWLKWLPHSQHPTRVDITGSARLMYPTFDAFDADFGRVLSNRSGFQPVNPDDVKDASIKHPTRKDPYTIVVSDKPMPRRAIRSNVLWLTVTATARTTDFDASGALITVNPDKTIDLAEARDLGACSTSIAISDAMTSTAAQAFARNMAVWRPSGAAAIIEATAVDKPTTLTGIHGIVDATTVTPAALWKPLLEGNPDKLKAVIGFTTGNDPVYLDLKDVGETGGIGHGCHGMVIGTTGSGKSEFLRSLVLSLMLTHSPDDLNVVFGDFKGDVTFTEFEGLTHIAGQVSDRDDSKEMVQRMRDVLEGEHKRRLDLLRQHGFQKIADYEKARQNGEIQNAPALPALLVIIDEAAAMLKEYPELIDTCDYICRQGRATRIHLLLATQTFDHALFHKLEGNLAYRIALRTATTEQSRAVINAPDAAKLPQEAGWGIFKPSKESDEKVKFRAPYVSAMYTPPARTEFGGEVLTAADIGNYIAPQRFTASEMHTPGIADTTSAPVPAPAPATPEPAGPLLKVLADRLRNAGNPIHKLWLPPLRDPFTLDSLPDTPAPAPGQLLAPWALVDEPAKHAQSTWSVDLTSTHIAIVGTRQTGKSTALLTLMLSAARRYTPRELSFMAIDFGGGQMNLAEELPNVVAVAGQNDTDVQRRIFATLESLLTARQESFRRRRFASVADFRAAKAAGNDDGLDAYGDVVLVVDGWDQAKKVIDPDDDRMSTLLGQGLSYGIHVIVSAPTMLGVGYKLAPNFTRWIAFGGETSIEQLTTAEQRSIPTDIPGRCMTPGASKPHMMIATPRLDGVPDASNVTAAFTAAARELATQHDTAAVPGVTLLPDRPSFDEMYQAWQRSETFAFDKATYRVPFGVRESDLTAARASFMTDPHLVILGSAAKGKTTAVAALLEAITTTYTADEARIVLIDPKRQHLDAVPADMLALYGYTAEDAVRATKACVTQLPTNRPPAGVSQEELRTRSYRKKRELFVIVDDYHTLVRRSSINPFAELAEFIPIGVEVGFHLIIARDITGSSLATAIDPVLAGLNGQCGLVLLNGNKAEGKIFDTIAPAPQPTGRGQYVTGSGLDLVQLAEHARVRSANFFGA